MGNLRRVTPACALALIVMVGSVGCGKQPVAVVNGSKIARQEFVDRLEETAGDNVLGELIVRRLLEDAFAKSGLQISPQEAQEEMATLAKQAGSPEAFQAGLRERGLDEAKLADMLTFQLKVRKLSEQGVNPTEQDLKKEFSRYRQDFDRPATVVLSEIVVDSQAAAAKIRQQLNDPKASFPALARQHSLSTMTRERGGRRGEEPQQQVMPEPLRPVVARLAVGGVSSPIEVDGNWYIIRVEEKKAAAAANYAKVKDAVRRHYMATKGKNVNDMIGELVKTAKVSIQSPRYQKLQERFGPPQALPSFGGGEGKGQTPAAGAAPAAPTTPAAPEAPAQPPAGPTGQ